jgi:hypothetical protein
MVNTAKKKSAVLTVHFNMRKPRVLKRTCPVAT